MEQNYVTVTLCIGLSGLRLLQISNKGIDNKQSTYKKSENTAKIPFNRHLLIFLFIIIGLPQKVNHSREAANRLIKITLNKLLQYW